MHRMTHPIYPIIHSTLSTHPHSNLMADCDPNKMEESEEPVGRLYGKLKYKENKDGTINKHVVICTHCRKEFLFH